MGNVLIDPAKAARRDKIGGSVAKGIHLGENMIGIGQPAINLLP
jgi:hypothetical protein